MKNLAYNCGEIVNIFKLIDSVSKKGYKLHRETIRTTQITPSQYAIISLLWERDERQFKELSAIYGSSRAAMTGIVDSLEKNGLIERKNHPTDRRSILVKLTEKGRNLQKKIPELEPALSDCCASITAEEFEQLGWLLSKLDLALGRTLGEIN